MKLGVLTLIDSKYEPVFKTPMLIQFPVNPKIGESFLFTDGMNNMNTSIVKTIMWDSEEPLMHLVTRNSIYQLQFVLPIKKHCS